MWQRFTDRARRVVFFAQEEAGRLGENQVATEHLLLAMCRENDTVAARILDRIGVPVDKIRVEIERVVVRGEGPLTQDVQLTPRARRVIDLAFEEARQFRNDYIGVEHLLLSLIRVEEGMAGRVLAKLGVDIERTRREVQAMQDNSSPSGAVQPSPEHYTDRTLQAVRARIIEHHDGWRGRSLVTLSDVSAEQFRLVLDIAAELKAFHKAGEFLQFPRPRTMALLFEKPSLRTRVSFEAGMAHLGGTAIQLSPQDVGLGVRETVQDVATALSRWVDIVAARVFKQETVEELVREGSVPVINALSDREHPCQAFADLLTLREHKGELGNNLKIAYVGDGNNVLHSLLLACAKTGVHCSAACPEGYFPDLAYVEEAQRIGQEDGTGARIEIVTDPAAAVRDADAIYTDVWASMGQEAEKEARALIFAPYQVNAALMAKAKSDAVALHCLPAHRGEEISADVMAAHYGVIMDQAENRLHTQKALVALILGL